MNTTTILCMITTILMGVICLFLGLFYCTTLYVQLIAVAVAIIVGGLFTAIIYSSSTK